MTTISEQIEALPFHNTMDLGEVISKVEVLEIIRREDAEKVANLNEAIVILKDARDHLGMADVPISCNCKARLTRLISRFEIEKAALANRVGGDDTAERHSGRNRGRGNRSAMSRSCTSDDDLL